MTDVVGVLDADDQQALARLLTKMLTRLYNHLGHAQYMCRLCDRTCCTADSTCPVGQAELEDRAGQVTRGVDEPTGGKEGGVE